VNLYKSDDTKKDGVINDHPVEGAVKALGGEYCRFLTDSL